MKTSRQTTLSILSMLLVGLGSSCATTNQVADTKSAVLVPDASWACGMPEGIPRPEDGAKVFEAKIALDQIYDIGKVQYGKRKAIVGQEGTLSGEKINGKVLPGCLDFELTLSNGATEIEQVLVLQTDDGKAIYVRNAGIGMPNGDTRVVADFEAPNGSAYEWLNTGKYVARRAVDSEAKTMTMTVYDVGSVAIDTNATALVKVEKPTDMPPQPWDPRTRDATEKQGEQIIVEMVALGSSPSVGASKRGNRNIIPITGGTLSGKINGVVLFGGADYQSANPMLDARYLWKTDDGEVIIVRNAGGFVGLVPTFEAKVDGNYAWLNTGKFLSSSPGMGGGGVSLTFYKSE